MKCVILLCLCATAVLSAPQTKEASEPIPILRQDSQDNGDGSYQYSFETGNGINAEQKGELKKVGDIDAIEVQGQFQYPGENGPIVLTYVADENGFHPMGDHLPTAPPVPAPIQRALEYLATASPPSPPAENVQ
ncbi:hypothetical protein JYU34_016430 [Plutella xylostella]|uniref:Uncharacterized protein n=1 Tax=Plutella xylostella TaxID=51655 RepID=A0ABQ7Q2W3_PLUXY|nr:hypothetical protein JYU34_016430 [Plutella xylostella]